MAVSAAHKVVRRFHLFEFHDLNWYSPAWRDLLTDVMTFFAVKLKPYRVIVPMLQDALNTLRCPRVVDLCSGAGGPILSVLERLGDVDGHPVEVTLTDKYPNVSMYRAAAAAWPGRVSYHEESVDATNVPEHIEGFRTLFTSFHHFDVEAARGILRDAVRRNQGVAVFEYTERNLLVWALPLLFGWAFVWVTTPFMKPFRWQRLLWTYVFPLWMLCGLWDGLVSCLRTYTPRELQEMTADLGGTGYSWHIGRVRSIGACRVTYLLGVPHPQRPV